VDPHTSVSSPRVRLDIVGTCSSNLKLWYRPSTKHTHIAELAGELTLRNKAFSDLEQVDDRSVDVLGCRIKSVSVWCAFS